LYSSFVRTIQSFICLAEPEAAAGSTNDPKTTPEEKTDVAAAAAPAAESAAPAEDGLAPRVMRGPAPGSGASTHPVG